MRKQRFTDILRKTWIKTIAALSIVFVIGFTTTLTITSRLIQERSAEAIATNIASTIEPKLRVGDEYNVKRYLNRLTARNELLAVSVVSSSSDQAVTAFSEDIPAEVRRKFSSRSENDEPTLFSSYWISSRELTIFEGEQLTIRIAHRNADIPAILWGGIAGSLLFAFLAILIAFYFSKISFRRITGPLEKLVQTISSGASPKIPDPEIDQIAETSQALARYQETSTALERQIAISAKFEGMAKMAQMAAHDMKRPFTLVKFVLTELNKEISSERRQELLAMLNQDAAIAMNTAEDLVDDILEMGTKPSVIPEEVSIHQLINVGVNNAIRINYSKPVSISYDLSHKHQVTAAPKRIRRVIANLLSNAFDAVGSGGKVWFRTYENDGFIEVIIGNSDSFISPEDRERVFEAFYTSGKDKGTGLGLAICKKIVEEHGGSIWCSSDSIYGTEFHITLPKSASSDFSDTQMITDVKPRPEGKLELLQPCLEKPSQMKQIDDRLAIALIDDDRIVRVHWESELANKVCLATFASPKDFLARADLSQFDCIITDFHLGSHRGDHLADDIRKRYDGPVLACTETKLMNDEKDSFDAVISKEPPSATYLLQTIARYGDKVKKAATNSVTGRES